MKFFNFISSNFLILFFFFSGNILTSYNLFSQKHKSISSQEVQLKLEELKNSELPDSIFYSTIGFFRKEKVRFSQIVENKLYVDVSGIFYRMDFADDFGNITISCTFFKPHIDFIPPPVEERDSTYAPLMNEHICRCKASFGYAVIRKEGKNFVCYETSASSSASSNTTNNNSIENYTINCTDLQSINSFSEKYFNFGYSIKEKIKILAKREILLLE